MKAKSGTATRSNGAKSGQPLGFPPTAWVKAELSESEKADLKGREISEAELVDSLEGIIAAGYKISISYDERSDCVGAYLTAPKELFPGRTVCLSARAPSVGYAITVLLYKHFEKLKEDWRGGLEDTKERDAWG